MSSFLDGLLSSSSEESKNKKRLDMSDRIHAAAMEKGYGVEERLTGEAVSRFQQSRRMSRREDLPKPSQHAVDALAPEPPEEVSHEEFIDNTATAIADAQVQGISNESSFDDESEDDDVYDDFEPSYEDEEPSYEEEEPSYEEEEPSYEDEEQEYQDIVQPIASSVDIGANQEDVNFDDEAPAPKPIPTPQKPPASGRAYIPNKRENTSNGIPNDSKAIYNTMPYNTGYLNNARPSVGQINEFKAMAEQVAPQKDTNTGVIDSRDPIADEEVDEVVSSHFGTKLPATLDDVLGPDFDMTKITRASLPAVSIKLLRESIISGISASTPEDIKELVRRASARSVCLVWVYAHADSSLANLLEAAGIITEDVQKILDVYLPEQSRLLTQVEELKKASDDKATNDMVMINSMNMIEKCALISAASALGIMDAHMDYGNVANFTLSNSDLSKILVNLKQKLK